jgi:hypothetical protein
MNAQSYLDKLRNLRLDHATFSNAFVRAHAHASMSAPTQLIIVAGPTRVGKTTLGKRLAHELISPYREEDGMIPLVRVEAATTNQAKFSTKHFTLRMLEELADPVSTIGEGISIRYRQSETHLRIQLERCLRFRKTRFLLVDEAQHLLRTTTGVRPGEVIDSLKSLANTIGLTIVLLGGYELLGTCIDSSHLNGRLTIIDFPPYGDDDVSIREFDRVLLALGEILPVKDSFMLNNREFLYRGSLGCVGLLMGWSMKAVAEMGAHSQRELRLEHFKATRYAIQNRAIANEIAFGAEILGRDHTLGESLQLTKQPSSRRGRPFVRKPGRDDGPGDRG